MALFGNIELPGKPDLENVRRLDLLPVPCIEKMTRLGFAINREHFHELTSQFSREMIDLRKDISSFIPPDKLEEFVGKSTAEPDPDSDDDSLNDDPSINVASSDQIAKLLFDILGVGEHKELKKTKSGDKISTGKEQLRELEFDHPVIPKILAYRERAKLINTYTRQLPKRALFHPKSDCCPVCELPHDASTWRVHTSITTTRQATGRTGSVRPNLQQLPSRSHLGALIRAGFVASPGKKLISVDLSQIELRLMAHLADCSSMIAVYQADGDIHSQTAMDVFGLTDPSQIDPIMHRLPSKVFNFLAQYLGKAKSLYGQIRMAMSFLMSDLDKKTGKPKLAALPEFFTGGLTGQSATDFGVRWCKSQLKRWHSARPEVMEYAAVQEYRARRYGMVWDPIGHVRLVPEVQSCHRWKQDEGARQSINFPDQGFAAKLLKLILAAVDQALIELREAGQWAWPLLPVHDEMLVEADEKWAEPLVLPVMTWEFDNVLTDRQTGELLCRVPIKSDGRVTNYWAKG